MMLLMNISDAFAILAAITSSVFYYKYRKSYLFIISPFLWYTAINEFVVIKLDEVLENDTGIFYNIHQIILFAILFWVIYKSLKNSKRIYILKVLVVIYTIIQIVDISINNFMSDYLSLSYLIGGVTVTIGIILYAIELLESQDIKFLHKDLTVWFLTANLFFWISYLPIYIIQDKYYDTISSDLAISLKYIQISCIIILNLLYIVGFIYSEKKHD